MDSFVRKALRKRDEYDDPFAEIEDKAGARVVVPYEAYVAEACETIEAAFIVEWVEEKSGQLGVTELGYLGTHLGVRLPEDFLTKHKAEALGGLVCEIQIHTKAQSAWADVSHELVYKAPQEPADTLKRAVYRLIVLVELFDGEVGRTRNEIMSEEGFPQALLIARLERELLRYTGRTPDIELSSLIVGALTPLFGDAGLKAFEVHVAPLIEGNDEKLQSIFDAYRHDERANILLFQPESFLIFAELERDRYELQKHWPPLVPVELLESLAVIWGEPL